MRVLVTGRSGQLGWELERLLIQNDSVLFTDKNELDISDETEVGSCVHAFKPTVIVNAAAYTAVDNAESNQALAFAVNSNGPKNLAKAAALVGARFVHISTDFVFEGQSKPYHTEDVANPLSVYGASKRLGEQLVLAERGSSLIIRTAWVYSSHGANFVKTMLRLMASQPKINVVSDQIGSPTWARGLAVAILTIARRELPLRGIVHFTDSGVASWYDFAVAIQEEAIAIGLLNSCVPIHPISSDQYPSKARRPTFCVLDGTSSAEVVGSSPHWRVQLRSMLSEHKTFLDSR